MRNLLRAAFGGVLILLPATAHTQLPALPSLPKPPFSQADANLTTQSMRRGLADVVRAASQSKSQAPTSPLIDRETAKGMSLDNQIKATNTFFQKRQLNRMYRNEERSKKNTQAEFNQWARDKAPDRLTTSQFDSYSGQINWPGVLRGEKYQAQRGKMESLYASHAAAGGGINTAQYAQIQRLAKEMQEALRGDLKNVTPEQYTYARKFLEGLGYEARHPVGS